ncbi:MAG: tRNA-(ms[2]io[6]A)-hydroxylase [Myxococcota bacterium]
MLHLASTTDPAWAPRVLAEPGELLVDHAHCEKKAAGMAINLLFRYPRQTFLMRPLSRLAREELSHFEEVLGMLAERGLRFCPQKPAPYAGRLREGTRSHEPARLLDTLLCGALIEARSCERFERLAEAAEDEGLRRFYKGLLVAEARHHGVYLALARELVGENALRERLAGLAAHEAEVLADSPELPRIHGA